MTDAEIVALSRRHTITEYVPQNLVDPLPVARAKGVYFWTADGRRFIDFNSQLMSVNIGHGDPRVVAAIAEQAAKVTYVASALTTEPRARLGAKLAAITPGDLDAFFFTNGGAEANETAFKVARAVTGRRKILARYRSYHGGTAGAMAATGEPRSWSQPPLPGFVHVLDPYHGIERGWDDAAGALAYLEEVIELEGPQTIAGFILETVTGANGILVPPDGYLQGVRNLCTKYGILMIADEVMAGFGRTGEWFAVDHWGVVPDLITMAKGLTSSYVPLGAVGMRRAIADAFGSTPFPGGLTYSGHALACAAALATIAVYEEDGLIARAKERGVLLAALHANLARRHPSVGAVRSIGLFGAIELVRTRTPPTPMAPAQGRSAEMTALAAFLRENGLFTLVRGSTVFTNPPLCISEDELREGIAIIDRGLEITDRATTDQAAGPG